MAESAHDVACRLSQRMCLDGSKKFSSFQVHTSFLLNDFFINNIKQKICQWESGETYENQIINKVSSAGYYMEPICENFNRYYALVVYIRWQPQLF